MSEPDDKLSIMLDEYSDDEPGHDVLNEVIGDVNLQYQLRRYQMIGDVMRHKLPEHINPNLSHQIMAEVNKINAVEKFATTTSTYSKGLSFVTSWATLRPFAGMAVAASVALVSVSIWQSVSTNPEPGQSNEPVVLVQQQKIEKFAGQPVLGNTVNVSSTLNEGTRWKVIKDAPALQQKLNAYLVNHTEYSIPMQGLIPQARVAGYDSMQ
ncbi:MAG: hypothetical protein GY820_26030 [Gammaproteobacteria bacterium]|nr:hypothetical protein [Gammaproteobacteria bacterium]